MGMEVYLIQAGLGDCILVRCGKGTKKVNILIDSGTKKEYFCQALNLIKTNQEKIDILVFTHDDNDHIRGAYNLLKQLEKENKTKNSKEDTKYFRIKTMIDTIDDKLFEQLTDDRILFNFGGNGEDLLLGVTEAKGLFESFERMNINKLGYIFADAVGPCDVPYPNMIQLQWRNSEHCLESEVIRQPRKKDLMIREEHLEILVLSPGKQALVRYIRSAWHEIQKKDVILSTNKSRKKKNEWERSIQYWMKNCAEHINNVSVVNQSSIAFLIIYGEVCGLFAGDAACSEMIRAGKEYLARKQMKQDYLILDFIKLPHHGSSHNVNEEFFRFFRTKTYFITTEGSAKNRHPGKITLAFIASALEKNETAHIYSSYSWWKTNRDFCRSEKYEGNWREDGNLCILEDMEGNRKYLHFHKADTIPFYIHRELSVRR